MIEYKPDNWVIVRIDSVKDGLFYKVLGGWSGGYLDGNSWRLNSGVTSFTEDAEFIYFHGYSGSVYKCHKDVNFTKMSIQGTLNWLLNQDNKLVKVSRIEFIDFKKEFKPNEV